MRIASPSPSAIAVEATRLPRRGWAPRRFDARDPVEARALAEAEGRRLWREACAAAQGEPRDLDDARLYWERLALGRAILDWSAPGVTEADRAAALATLERSSRGYDEDFTDPDALHLLVSGFDPFLLDPETGGPDAIFRANPSGAAALALSGRTLTEGGVRAEVRAAIFPVRYEDFDAGVVEAFYGPRLERAPDLVMTISQGRGQDFAVERWAGRRRSVPTPDNALRVSGGDERHPVVAPALGPGPELLATTLPAAALWSALGRPASADEELLWELRDGELHRGTTPTPGALAVRGSGGGYLSNEIFYRCARLRHARGLALPLGHLHTPFLAPPSAGGPDPAFEAHRARIVDEIETLLRALIPLLGAKTC